MNRCPRRRRRTVLVGGDVYPLAELGELFAVLGDRVDHLHQPLATHPDAPLQIHGRYRRIEILAAMGLSARAKIAAWQSGVYEAKPAEAELLAFTLDTSSGGFSPTTRYRDHAISRTLIHWESQSVPARTARPSSPCRYRVTSTPLSPQRSRDGGGRCRRGESPSRRFPAARGFAGPRLRISATRLLRAPGLTRGESSRVS